MPADIGSCDRLVYLVEGQIVCRPNGEDGSVVKSPEVIGLSSSP